LMEFYDRHVPVWDSAGLAAGRLTTITVKQELSWLLKNYKPKIASPVKTLVVGCGSGSEVYQYVSFYKDMEITALDWSPNNIAYAIRQHKDLGINNVKFCLADVYEIQPSNFPELFDMVIANGVIHHLNDPLRGWERIVSVLKSGGLLKMSLYTGRFVEVLHKSRTYLNSKGNFTPPLFTNESPLAQVRRSPTLDEIRDARYVILSCEDKGDNETLKDLVTSPPFFTLHEFADLVCHPKVHGFSFEIIGECLNKLGLKLVSFEFPGLSQEHYLKYIVEHPEDPEMRNFKLLEAFNKKHPDAFLNFTHTINFLAEKP